MNASAFSSLPIVKALISGQNFVGSPLNWNAGNNFQKQLLDGWDANLEQLLQLSDEEIAGIAASNAETINRFMAEHGFPDVTLSPWTDDGQTMGMGSVISLKEYFETQGEAGFTILNGLKAFRLGVPTVNFHYNLIGDLVIVINCKNGDQVMITKANSILSGFDLLNSAVKNHRVLTTTNQYDGVILPYWNLPSIPTNVEQMIGMHGTDALGDWYITQAAMKCASSFGCDGMVFKAGFVAAATRGMPPIAPVPPRHHVVNYDIEVSIWRGKLLAALCVPVGDFSSTKVEID
jgi:hypothetical protein